MTYEVSVSAEGDHIIVSLSGTTFPKRAQHPLSGRWYWGTRPATWTVSPPSLLAKLLGVTLSSKVARAVGKAVEMKSHLERQDERARLACAEATRVAGSALERKVKPERPWPPPPSSRGGYTPSSSLPKDARPPGGGGGLRYPMTTGVSTGVSGESTVHEVAPGELVGPASVGYGTDAPANKEDAGPPEGGSGLRYPVTIKVTGVAKGTLNPCIAAGYRVGECDRKCPFGLADKPDEATRPTPPTMLPPYPPAIKVGVVAPEPPVSEDDMAFVSSRPLPKLCYSWEGCAGWQGVADEVAP